MNHTAIAAEPRPRILQPSLRPSKSRRSRSSTLIGVALLAGLAACGDGAEPSEATRPSEPTDTSVGVHEQGEVADVDSSTSASMPSPTPPETDCLVGNWIVREAALQSYLDSATTRGGFDSVEASGEMRVSFADGTYTWTNDYVVDLAIGNVNYQMQQSGSFDGAYDADGEDVTGSIDHDDRTGRFTQDGAAMSDAGDLFTSVTLARPLDTARISCDARSLTIAAEPNADAKHEITLTRI